MSQRVACRKSAWLAAIVGAVAFVVAIPLMFLLRKRFLKDEEKALALAKKLEQDPEKVVGSGTPEVGAAFDEAFGACRTCCTLGMHACSSCLRLAHSCFCSQRVSNID